MTAAKGYVIALTQPASLVDITARGACWIRAQADGIVPSAPAVTPAPAPDASCNYEYLAANDSISFGADAYYNSTGPATQDMTKYIIVWAEEPGYLTISAH